MNNSSQSSSKSIDVGATPAETQQEETRRYLDKLRLRLAAQRFQLEWYQNKNRLSLLKHFGLMVVDLFVCISIFRIDPSSGTESRFTSLSWPIVCGITIFLTVMDILVSSIGCYELYCLGCERRLWTWTDTGKRERIETHTQIFSVFLTCISSLAWAISFSAGYSTTTNHLTTTVKILSSFINPIAYVYQGMDLVTALFMSIPDFGIILCTSFFFFSWHYFSLTGEVFILVVIFIAAYAFLVARWYLNGSVIGTSPPTQRRHAFPQPVAPVSSSTLSTINNDMTSSTSSGSFTSMSSVTVSSQQQQPPLQHQQESTGCRLARTLPLTVCFVLITVLGVFGVDKMSTNALFDSSMIFFMLSWFSAIFGAGCSLLLLLVQLSTLYKLCIHGPSSVPHYFTQKWPYDLAARAEEDSKVPKKDPFWHPLFISCFFVFIVVGSGACLLSSDTSWISNRSYNTEQYMSLHMWCYEHDQHFEKTRGCLSINCDTRSKDRCVKASVEDVDDKCISLISTCIAPSEWLTVNENGTEALLLESEDFYSMSSYVQGVASNMLSFGVVQLIMLMKCNERSRKTRKWLGWPSKRSERVKPQNSASCCDSRCCIGFRWLLLVAWAVSVIAAIVSFVRSAVSYHSWSSKVSGSWGLGVPFYFAGSFLVFIVILVIWLFQILNWSTHPATPDFDETGSTSSITSSSSPSPSPSSSANTSSSSLSSSSLSSLESSTSLASLTSSSSSTTLSMAMTELTSSSSSAGVTNNKLSEPLLLADQLSQS